MLTRERSTVDEAEAARGTVDAQPQLRLLHDPQQPQLRVENASTRVLQNPHSRPAAAAAGPQLRVELRVVQHAAQATHALTRYN
jgi:hypothetical protein